VSTELDAAFQALLAQIDQDALSAAASNPTWHRYIVSQVLGTGKIGARHQAAHIARWDPDRVLNQTKNLRLVLDLLELLAETRPLTARMIAQLLTNEPI
jgi:hypothetical protein